MNNTSIKPMTKEALTEIITDEYYDVIGDDEWVMLDSEVDAINKDQQTYSAPYAQKAGTYSHEKIISDRWRMDYKTHRMIREGYLCLEGDALFACEKDAVDFVSQRTGESYKDFNEVYEASERGDIGESYFTDWL